MSNCRTHRVAGAIAGGVWVGATAAELPGPEFAMVLGGGVVGGVIGGMLPDLLEPASTPRHRSLAHSWLTLAAVMQAGVNDWQKECHLRAGHYAAMAQHRMITPAQRLWCHLAVLFYRFLAGLLAGFKAGYTSHLVLDSTTPCSLPLIVR
jgi:membrane-bound metal-dependent hydrolase YbcI (DUF457 family)